MFTIPAVSPYSQSVLILLHILVTLNSFKVIFVGWQNVKLTKRHSSINYGWGLLKMATTFFFLFENSETKNRLPVLNPVSGYFKRSGTFSIRIWLPRIIGGDGLDDVADEKLSSSFRDARAPTLDGTLTTQALSTLSFSSSSEQTTLSLPPEGSRRCSS
jgi:hypothetical protein